MNRLVLLRIDQQAPYRRSRAGLVLRALTLVRVGAGVIVLVACGGASPTSVLLPAATATITATALTVTPSATVTVPRTTPISTATPPSPTVTQPLPTATTVPSPLPPTAATTPASSPALSPIATSSGTLYIADFTAWSTGEKGLPYPSRSGFDQTSGEYQLALTDAQRPYGAFRYGNELPRLADFRLDIDARAVAGPPGGSYGVAFRAVPTNSNEQTVAQYLFFVTNDGKYFLTQIADDGHGIVIAAPSTSAAIRPGGESNHLTVFCQGSQIVLAINSQTVGTYTAATTAAGGFGVGVSNPSNPKGSTGSDGMTAAFSNLRVLQAP